MVWLLHEMKQKPTQAVYNRYIHAKSAVSRAMYSFYESITRSIHASALRQGFDFVSQIVLLFMLFSVAENI